MSRACDSSARTRSLAVPMTTEISRMSPRLALVARQKPARDVCPVLMPSTLGSRQSRVLRLCWVIPFQVYSLVEYCL